MSHASDIDRYVKAPSLLVDLCREVIDRLDTASDDTETAAMEAQLREISKAIDNLEKAGIAVPDPLRAEKTRLAAALGIQAETVQALKHLADELDDILKYLKARLGHVVDEPTEPKKYRKKSLRSPKTDKEVLREHIVLALRNLGGSAKAADVLEAMENQLKGKLLPGDLEIRQDGKTIAWQNNACWERYQMVQKGILKTDSPRGIWELSEEYR